MNIPYELTEVETLVDLLCRRSCLHSNKIIYSYIKNGVVQESLSFRSLDCKARAIAVQLQDCSRFGDRALLIYPPGLEYIAAFFGCLYAGVIAVPTYPPKRNRADQWLQSILQNSKSTLVLTNGDILADIKKYLECGTTFEGISYVTTDNIDIEYAKNWNKPQITAKTLAFLQYTSGSTSSPKGVMLSHHNLLHNLSLIYQAFEHSSESRVVSWLPPYHDMGLIGGILQPLYAGMSAFLMSPTCFIQQPYCWLKAISDFKATTSGAPNFAYDLSIQKISQAQKETLDLSCWDLAFTGAEPIRHDTLERFYNSFSICGFRKQSFYPCYGLAENTLFVTGKVKKELPSVAIVDTDSLLQHNIKYSTIHETTKLTLLVSSGCALPEQKIKIVDPLTTSLCLPDQIGEIWISSQSVASGYWNLQVENERTFNARLPGYDDKFLRTGDLGFIHENELFVTGRIKDLIVIRGLNYYPQDIELTIENSHTALQDNACAAFSIEIDNEERLVIVQEIKRTYFRKLNIEEVISAISHAIFINHGISVYAITLLMPGAIPKTSSGKIQRSKCRLKFIKKEFGSIAEWIQSNNISSANNFNPCSTKDHQHRLMIKDSLQTWLVSRLASYLKINVSTIDVEKPLSEYGLDSSVAISLTCELEKWSGLKFEPTLFWDYPTVKELSKHVSMHSTNHL